MNLPDPTVNRVGKWRKDHPDTSRQAALAVYPRSGDQRLRVLRAIWQAGDAGLTDYELEREGFTRSSASTRRYELQQMGWVADSGLRRPTGTGQQAIVWVASEKAVELLFEKQLTKDDLKLPEHLKARKGVRSSPKIREMLELVVSCQCQEPCCKSVRKHIKRYLDT